MEDNVFEKPDPQLEAYEASLRRLGHVTPSGRPTTKTFKAETTLAPETQVREGIVKEDKNMLEVAGDAFTRGALQFRADMARGITREQDFKAEFALGEDKSLVAPKWSEGFMTAFVDRAAEGVANTLPSIAAGAVNPALGWATTYTRSVGSSARRIAQENPDMTSDQAYGIALLEAIPRTAIEHGVAGLGGGSQNLSKILAGNKSVTSGIGKTFAETLRQNPSLVRRMGAEFFDPTNPLSGMIKSGIEETLEESADFIVTSTTDFLTTGKGKTLEEMVRGLFIDPLNALPAGVLSGSVTYNRQASKASVATEKVTDDDVINMHTKTDEAGDPLMDQVTGQVVVDEASIQKEAETFNTVADIFKQGGVENSQSVAEVIKSASYAMAKAEQMRGNKAMPADFAETFKAAFLDVDAKGKDFDALNSIIGREIDPVEKTDAVLDYLGKRFGDTSRVYKQFYDVAQEMEATMLQENMAGIDAELEQMTFNPKDKEAVAIVKAKVQSALSGVDMASVKEATAGGQLHIVDTANIDPATLPSDVYSSLLVKPYDIKMGKQTYRVSARKGYLTIQLAKEAKAATKAQSETDAKAEVELRSYNESLRNMVPLKEVTNSDARLAAVKRNAQESMAKHRVISSEMDTFNKRVGTKLNEPAFTVEMPVEQTAQDTELLTEEQLAQLDEEEVGAFTKIRNKLFGEPSPEIQETKDTELQMNGLYMPQYRSAIFFKGADEATILHEFFHHMRPMLSPQLQNDLLTVLGNEQEVSQGMWTSHAEEAFTDTMLVYLREGALPADSSTNVAKAIDDIAGALKRVVGTKEELTEDTRALFDELLGDVESLDIHGIIAEASMASMAQDAPSAEQAMAAGVSAEITGPPKKARAEAYRRIGGKFAKELSKSKMKAEDMLHALAVENIAWFDNTSSVRDLTTEEVNKIVREMDRKPTVPTAQTLQDVLDWEKQHEGDNTHQKVYAGTRRKEAVQHMDNWMGKVKAKTVASLYNLRWMCQHLDRGADDGPYRRLVNDAVQVMRHTFYAKRNATLDHMAKVQRKLGIDLYKTEGRRVDLGGFKRTLGEAVIFDMATKNKKTKQSLMESNGITEQEFADAKAFVKGDKDAQALRSYIQEGYELLYDDLAKVYKEMTGKTLRKVKFYFALTRMDDTFSEHDEIMTALESLGDVTEQDREARQNMLEERKASKGGMLRLSDPVESMHSYLDQANTYITKAKPAKELSDQLNAGPLEQALVNSYGQRDGSTLHKALRDHVRRELFANAKMEATTGFDKTLQQARSMLTISSLGGRATVVVVQALSKLLGYSMFKGSGIGVVAQDFKNSLEIANVILKNEGRNMQREVNGEWKTKGFLHWIEGSRLYKVDENGNESGLWAKYAQPILAGISNPATVDQNDVKLAGLANTTFMGKKLGEVFMEGIGMMDVHTVGSQWLTIFDDVSKQELKNNGGDIEQAEAKAARVANDFIAKYHPPRTQHDRPLAATGKESVKTLMMFSSQPLQNMAMLLEEVVRPSIDAIQNKDIKALIGLADPSNKGEYGTRLPRRVMLSLIVPAIAMGMRARRREPTEEELIKDLLFYPVSQIPMVGGAISYMFVNDKDDANVEGAYNRVVNDTLEAMKTITNAMSGEELKEYDYKKLAQSGLTWLNLPTVAADFGVEVVKGLSDENYTIDTDVILRGIGAKRQKKPE